MRSRNGFHVPKLVRNDISHLIIGLLVKFFSKYPLAAILNFCRLLAKCKIGFMRNFRRAIDDYLGILRSIFSSDIQISTVHSVYTTIFHKLTAVILNFQCQSGILAHINRNISCINNPQKSLYIPICKVPHSAT